MKILKIGNKITDRKIYTCPWCSCEFEYEPNEIKELQAKRGPEILKVIGLACPCCSHVSEPEEVFHNSKNVIEPYRNKTIFEYLQTCSEQDFAKTVSQYLTSKQIAQITNKFANDKSEEIENIKEFLEGEYKI